MRESRIDVKLLCLTALFAALTAVATAAITIPMPTGGYINFGDSVIFLSAVCLGGFPAAIAGGLGSMLIDLILAPIYAPFTLVIKAVEALVLGLFIGVFSRFTRRSRWREMSIGLIGMILSASSMVVLYYLTDVVLYGSFAAAIATFVPNIIQASVSVAIGFTLCYILQLRHLSAKFIGVRRHFITKNIERNSSTPAAPATPAVPATPVTQTTPAAPAVPAAPATPAMAK